MLKMVSTPQVALTQAPNPPTPVVTLTQRPTCPFTIKNGFWIEASQALDEKAWNNLIPRIQRVIEGSHLAAEAQKNEATTPLKNNQKYIDFTDSKITGFEIPLSNAGDAKITYYETSTTKPNWLGKPTTTHKEKQIDITHARLHGLNKPNNYTQTPYFEELTTAYFNVLNDDTSYEATETEETKTHLKQLEQIHTELSFDLEILRADPNTALSDKSFTNLIINLPCDIEIPSSDTTSVDNDKPVNNIFNYSDDATQITSTINTALQKNKPSVMTIKIERQPHVTDSTEEEVQEPLYLSIFIDPKTNRAFIYNPKKKDDEEVKPLIKAITTSIKSKQVQYLHGHSTIDSSEIHKRQILLFVNKMASNAKHQQKALNEFLSEMKQLRSKTQKETDASLLQAKSQLLAKNIEANLTRKIYVTKILGYTSQPMQPIKTTPEATLNLKIHPNTCKAQNSEAISLVSSTSEPKTDSSKSMAPVNAVTDTADSDTSSSIYFDAPSDQTNPIT